MSLAVQWGIVFSGIFLWVGMLTGVWKYWQIATSLQARAHYYVDIAHRSSLLYAPASLILAVLSYFSAWSAWTNLLCVLLNIFFFSFSTKLSADFVDETKISAFSTFFSLIKYLKNGPLFSGET